jgi:hypothetical protein
LKRARQQQLALNVTPDYKYLILLCGIFNPKRTMINHWSKYEAVFTRLLANDASEHAANRLLQATIFLHLSKYPIEVQLATACMKLYESELLGAEVFCAWQSGKGCLDKNSCMHNKKLEKAAKPLL